MSGGFGNIFGSIVSTIGQIQQSSAASQAAEYNAAVARNNALAARQQAAANADALERKSRNVIGSSRMNYAASGVSLEGSPLDVLEEQAMMAELDRQNTIYSGELKAIGFQNEAQIEDMRAKNARSAGAIGVASSLFSGMSANLMRRS